MGALCSLLRRNFSALEDNSGRAGAGEFVLRALSRACTIRFQALSSAPAAASARARFAALFVKSVAGMI